MTVAGGMASGISRKGADRNSPNAENIELKRDVTVNPETFCQEKFWLR
jgi:hypothetical protein